MEPACEAYNFDSMHDYLYTNGITIYPGKLHDLNSFRVANIGDLTKDDIEHFLTLLEQYLQRIGFYAAD